MKKIIFICLMPIQILFVFIIADLLNLSFNTSILITIILFSFVEICILKTKSIDNLMLIFIYNMFITICYSALFAFIYILIGLYLEKNELLNYVFFFILLTLIYGCIILFSYFIITKPFINYIDKYIRNLKSNNETK